jgi:polyisoprenoid-binding protein YceI
MRALLRTVALACLVTGRLVAGAASPAGADAGERHAIDAAKSKAQFSIQHIFVERVTGTIPILSGTVTLAPGSLVPTAVDAVLDPAHVDSGDRDRDASLRSGDYFDTQQFPTWTFTSSKVTSTGPAAFGMDGTLTIHGVAQPEHLDVTVTGDPKEPVYHAAGHIDRHAFGMKGARLDPVIGKTADVTLTIVLAR